MSSQDGSFFFTPFLLLPGIETVHAEPSTISMKPFFMKGSL